MTLHLLKLAVGVNSVEHLAELQTARLAEARAAGRPPLLVHVTRQTPKETAALLDGGSLYWVIKGTIQARQHLVDIRPFTDGAGIKRCDLVLEPILHPTRPHPRRPFQGWRYLKPEDAPADLTRLDGSGDIPDAMRRELVELCLI